jgi:transcriptional regulator GlxA family with amidase domain
MSESAAAHDQMERVRNAHERLKAVRVEYETVSAAAGFADPKSAPSKRALRERYAEALEEFLHQ